MTPDIQKLLARLAKLRTEDHRIITCYLKVEPRDRIRGKYLIKLKNRIRLVESGLEGLGLTRATRQEVIAELRRIQDQFKDPKQLPATHGVAVFACGALKLFEQVALPTVHRSRIAVERTPLVRELAAVEEEFGNILTVVLDRTEARIFEVTAYQTTQLEHLTGRATRGGRFHSNPGTPGIGEYTYHNRIREEKQRHFANISEHLLQLHRKRPVQGIVLAGPGKEAGAVAAFLHPYLADRLMGVVSLNPKDASPAVVHEATLTTRAEYERESERSVAHGLAEVLGEGWAVNGLDNTLLALAKGQVRTLLVDADALQPGFQSRKSGRLAVREQDLQVDGDVVPVLDLVDEAIEESLRQRVEVEVLYDDTARAAINALGGLLRFR